MKIETKLRLLMTLVAVAMTVCPWLAVLARERHLWAIVFVSANTLAWAFFLWLWFAAVEVEEVKIPADGERGLRRALMMDEIYGHEKGRQMRIEELRKQGRWNDGKTNQSS